MVNGHDGGRERNAGVLHRFSAIPDFRSSLSSTPTAYSQKSAMANVVSTASSLFVPRLLELPHGHNQPFLTTDASWAPRECGCSCGGCSSPLDTLGPTIIPVCHGMLQTPSMRTLYESNRPVPHRTAPDNAQTGAGRSSGIHLPDRSDTSSSANPVVVTPRSFGRLAPVQIHGRVQRGGEFKSFG